MGWENGVIIQDKTGKNIQYIQIDNIFPYNKNIYLFNKFPYAIIINTTVDKS